MIYKDFIMLDKLNNIANNHSSKFACILDDPSTYEKHKDFIINDYLSSDDNNKKLNTDNKINKSNIRPFSKWYDHTFGKNVLRHKCFTQNAIFGISKKDILKNSKNYYEKMISNFNHQNNETVHYFERSWPEVFKLIDDKYFIYQ